MRLNTNQLNLSRRNGRPELHLPASGLGIESGMGQPTRQSRLNHPGGLPRLNQRRSSFNPSVLQRSKSRRNSFFGKQSSQFLLFRISGPDSTFVN